MLLKKRVKHDWSDLEKLYIEDKLGTHRIGKIKDCGSSVVFAALHRLNIPLRSSPKPLDSNRIKELYLKDKLSRAEIADIMGYNVGGVASVITRAGIGRSRSEGLKLLAAKGKIGAPHGSKHPRWAGGKTKRGQYTAILHPEHPRSGVSGYVLEHILVWEEYQQKSLPKGWEIHHINGIKTDNRPENLLALPSKKHSLVIPKLKEKIRQLEIENRQLRRALEDNQAIFYIGEN